MHELSGHVGLQPVHMPVSFEGRALWWFVWSRCYVLLYFWEHLSICRSYVMRHTQSFNVKLPIITSLPIVDNTLICSLHISVPTWGLLRLLKFTSDSITIDFPTKKPQVSTTSSVSNESVVFKFLLPNKLPLTQQIWNQHFKKQQPCGMSLFSMSQVRCTGRSTFTKEWYSFHWKILRSVAPKLLAQIRYSFLSLISRDKQLKPNRMFSPETQKRMLPIVESCGVSRAFVSGSTVVGWPAPATEGRSSAWFEYTCFDFRAADRWSFPVANHNGNYCDKRHCDSKRCCEYNEGYTVTCTEKRRG